MRLKRVRLSGFKSFAEATSVEFRDPFAAVVGPNGCGKSNILDAVRWVIGERSPRHLRGSAMNDVIFSGTDRRGPLGRASVELLFDNADGSFGGPHASRAEISVRRELERDAESHYSLFGERCRRRDVADLFLGTGLGTRGSYAIVAQGMISQLVEAHPRELRAQLEEAAGISLYRERRRETELRLQCASEHLARLDDLRGELAQRLQQLSRQAGQARRHTELRGEERRLRAGGIVSRYRALSDESELLHQQLATVEDRLGGELSSLRAIDEERERLVDSARDLATELERNQARCYELGAEVARLEAARSERRRRAGELREEAERLGEDLLSAERQLAVDEDEDQQLRDALQGAAQELADARREAGEGAAARQRDETQLWQLQQRWEASAASAAAAATAAQALVSRVEALRAESQRLATELQRMASEASQLPALLESDPAAGSAEAVGIDDRETALAVLLASLPSARERIRSASAELHRCRCRIEELAGQCAAVERLPDSEQLHRWLAAAQLDGQPPLAASLEVEEGWQLALELVLGERLHALCVADVAGAAAGLATQQQPSQPVQLLQLQTQAGSSGCDEAMLLSKVLLPAGLESVLWGVYCAEDAAAARQLATRLKPGQSVVSRDGLWLGSGWLQLAGTEAGPLRLRRHGEQLGRELERARTEESAALSEVDKAQDALSVLESRAEALREASAAAAIAEQHQQLDARRQRDAAVARELAEQLARLEVDAEAAQRRADAEASARDQLAEQCQSSRETLSDSQRRASAAEAVLRQQALAEAARSARLEALAEAATRLRRQAERLGERREELRGRGEQLEGDDPQLETQLQQQLRAVRSAEQERDRCRRQLDEVEQAQRGNAERRTLSEREQRELRDGIEGQRVRLAAIGAEQSACAEQLTALDLELEALLRVPPEPTQDEDLAQQLALVERRIARLGPVNLAAEAEHAEQLERKDYLDSQHEEGSAAVSRLQGAIQRIDGEARRRFREAFQAVNTHLGELFPQLFGGGTAVLQLESEPDDGGEPGLCVLARPPGKKNCNIRQLSGGEKSLTAVALVFALFRLNPAPFCMLDEVDSQLDDLNASRFADLVQLISKEVQLICISHNRIVMERAGQLSGITMSEPGVSRLVSVDVEQAVASAGHPQPVDAQLGT